MKIFFKFFQIFKTNKFFFKGLFAYGNGCKIYNLTISDVELETNSNNVAIVFSRCENCKMDNIEITTSSEEKRNKIEGAQNVGGLASILENSEIRNCSISNTDFFSTCKSQVSMGSFASIVSHSIMGDCSIKNNNFLVFDEKTFSHFRFVDDQDYYCSTALVGGFAGSSFYTNITYGESIYNTFNSSSFDSVVGAIVGYQGFKIIFLLFF